MPAPDIVLPIEDSDERSLDTPSPDRVSRPSTPVGLRPIHIHHPQCLLHPRATTLLSPASSEVSVSSYSSTSSRPSPPPMTSTSTMNTPHSLFTPAPASRLAIGSPSLMDSGSRLGTTSSPGLVRVKSFPHTADLLGNTGETSRLPSPASSTHDEGMDVDPDAMEDVMTGAVSSDGSQTIRANDDRSMIPQDMRLRELREMRERDALEDEANDPRRSRNLPSLASAGGSASSSSAHVSRDSGRPADGLRARFYMRSPTPPRVELDPRHLAASDGEARTSGLHELGHIHDGFTPAAYRPRADLMAPSVPLSTELPSGPPMLFGARSTSSGERFLSAPRLAVEHRPSRPSGPIRISSPPLGTPSYRLGAGVRDTESPHARHYLRRTLPTPAAQSILAFDGQSEVSPRSRPSFARRLAPSPYEPSLPADSERFYQETNRRSSHHEPFIDAILGHTAESRVSPPVPASGGLVRPNAIFAWRAEPAPADTLDFSPQRQMREDREASRRRRMIEESFRDMEARGEERSIADMTPPSGPALARSMSGGTGPRSASHMARLARFDAMRNQAERFTPPSHWAMEPWWDRADFPLEQGSHPFRSGSPTSSTGVASAATNTSRLAVASLLDTTSDVDERPLASGHVPAPRRGVSTERPNRRDSFGEPSEIGVWNRDVQDAIGRRLPADRPRSPPWPHRYRENAIRYQQPRPIPPARRDEHLSDVDSPIPRARPTARDLSSRWGEVPDNLNRPRAGEPMREFGTSLEWPFTEDYQEERLRTRSFAGPGPQRDNFRGYFRDALRDPPRDQWWMGDPERRSVFDSDWLNRHRHDYDPPSMYNLYAALGDADPRQGRAGPHTSSFAGLQLKPEMSEAEKRTAVELLVKAVSRLPTDSRRKMAETTLEHVAWGGMGKREDMPRDEYCSVCHDEYDETVKISITPCKHMYHKDCLDTWLHTPNTSSCPMCRRDLAVLACLTKMVPGKKRDDAMVIWSAL